MAGTGEGDVLSYFRTFGLVETRPTKAGIIHASQAPILSNSVIPETEVTRQKESCTAPFRRRG